jgi:ABC-type antimicrobial peptide transport system permease subunit
LAISNVSTLSAELEEHLAPRTVTTALLGSFALVASLLAAVGIYGVVAYATLQRSRELVIRAALGASPARLLRLLLRKGLVLCAAGIGCGLVVAAVASRALASLLYGVSLSSPEPYLFAAAAFAVVALAAFLAPAWRGSNAAPALAMRNT